MADMRDTVNGFIGANTFVIVSVCIGVATINILQERSALPCQRRGADRRRGGHWHRNADVGKIISHIFNIASQFHDLRLSSYTSHY